MEKSKPIPLVMPILVNGHNITHVIIGRHYLANHSLYMNDEIIINLVISLDGKQFSPDSITGHVEYFVSDIQINHETKVRTYRLIWLYEGDYLQIVGVINAYRVKKRKK